VKQLSMGVLRQCVLGCVLAAVAVTSMAQRTAATNKAAGKAGTTVLVAHPVVASLSGVLTKDTDIGVEVLAPASIPPTRMASYFHGRGNKALVAAATRADAVIDIRSIWSTDPLYPLARRTNIRIVEIDAARPIDGELPGIAVQPGTDYQAYPWLNTVNLGRMADVIAADLEKLSPASKAGIAKNLAELKQRLVTLSAQTEAQLASFDNVSVATLSDRLNYLIASFNLDLMGTEVHADDYWNAQAVKNFSDKLKADGVAVVLHHQEPLPELKQAIEAAGSTLVVLSVDGADPIAEQEAHAKQLIDAFKQH
jgi:ABC-type Zn uptake system ZnuABC Zn-binding protein ZnuA